MNHRVGKIRNIRTIKALRGDKLKIDLGKTFKGTLKSWMKKDPNSPYYRKFDIVDNRFLVMSELKTIDYIDSQTSEVIEKISGKWYFDVEQTLDDGSSTVVTGTIFFIDDITCSNGYELFVDVSTIFNNQFNNIFS